MWTTSLSVRTVRSSVRGARARPWAEASRSAWTKLRASFTPFGGPSAVTTASRSPTTGSRTQNTPVAPAIWAVSSAGVALTSAFTVTTAGGVCTVGPSARVQTPPCSVTLGCTVSGAVMRMAVTFWSPASTTLAAWGRPWGASLRSSPALASNTSQMASPRRNTAAPTGARQSKCMYSTPAFNSGRSLTTPEVGIGLTACWAVWSAAVEADGSAYRFT